ncbi:hypothetical protein SLEP1_g4716 [Rubroshorea leprosula]|uniref:Uncharacterized protein n=1 Tax=Rubroshorea leprosula TaxID=152421 RepID=A0AAV5HVE6_9ROSI|nr:hypothetical protein SLEP1_g4716 [Rubroshorea leprosula]
MLIFYHLSLCTHTRQLFFNLSTTLKGHWQLTSFSASLVIVRENDNGCLPELPPLISNSKGLTLGSNNYGNFLNLFEELEENDNEDDESREVISST